jgi:hypothetical protein
MRVWSLAATAIAAMGLAFGAPGIARADTVYTLNVTQSGDIGSGPFGTVTVHLNDSTHALVTFQAAVGYVFGDGNAADVNVNATTWTIGSFSNSPPFTGTSMDGGNVNGFGTFNQVTTTGNFNAGNTFSTLSFVLTNTSATWANDASVLTANSQGFSVAAHVQFGAQCTITPTACTGFVANGNVAVPGPLAGAGLPGLIAACGGLIALARRRRQKVA